MRLLSIFLLVVFAWTGSLSWAARPPAPRGCCAKHVRKVAPGPRLERVCCCDHECKSTTHGRCGCKVESSSSTPTDRRRAVVPGSSALRMWQLLSACLVEVHFLGLELVPEHRAKRSTAPPPLAVFARQSPKRLC